MGSIADLLGDQLRAGLAQLVDPATEDDATEGAQASSIDAGEYVSTQDRAREAAMEAVLDEADLAPGDARAELTLRKVPDKVGLRAYHGGGSPGNFRHTLRRKERR